MPAFPRPPGSMNFIEPAVELCCPACHSRALVYGDGDDGKWRCTECATYAVPRLEAR